MSDNDRNEAREAAARAFTGLCCVTVADEVCEDCVGALLYLAWMHEVIEYLHLRDFAQQNTIRNLRRRHSRALAALEQAQAERDHLRRALEWLGDQWGGERHSGQKSDGHGPNCPLQPTVDLRDRTSCPYAPEAWHQPCQVIEGNITWRECCLRSALAATEEAHECRYCEGRGAVLGALGEDGDGYEVPCPRCNPLATEEAPDE